MYSNRDCRRPWLRPQGAGRKECLAHACCYRSCPTCERMLDTTLRPNSCTCGFQSAITVQIISCNVEHTVSYFDVYHLGFNTPFSLLYPDIYMILDNQNHVATNKILAQKFHYLQFKIQ